MPDRPRLSARRGSSTAPDPFGVHSEVNLNPNRTSSSVLTIVRVPSNTATTPSPGEPPAVQRRLSSRRPPTSTPAETGPARLSFAFSSFGGGSGGGGGHQRPSSPNRGPPSPSSSPRLRPSSPHLSASTFGGKPRLTPDQLVDLARQATKPAVSPGATVAIQSSPVLRPTLPNVQTQPATFTPLPDDIYLPFIDRPSEVSSLISTPPDAKLFTLLAQTFTAKTGAVEEKPNELPRDPAQWTYAQLIIHLTQIDRDVAPDFIWAIAARKCILSHSELIWERIKGALGVPPELDVDYEFLNDDESSPDTSDISDDEGKGARGHWSDWDAVMDSPMYARLKRLSSDAGGAEAHYFRSQMDDRLHGLQADGFVQSSSTEPGDDAGESTIAPTPQQRDEQGILSGNFNPYDGDTSTDYISIEPLIHQPNIPSLTLPVSAISPGDGLGDIAEGAEEEEEGESAESTPAAEADDPNLISPSQIQGLRISTSPLPPTSSSAVNTPPIDVLSPISPLPPYPTMPSSSELGAQPIPSSSSFRGSGDSRPHSRAHSRASSFSSIGPFQRSESTGNLSASWSAAAIAALTPHAAAGGGGSVIGSDAGDSAEYISDRDGDRHPGQPLFPSNFARLNVGPSMKANNPATRPPHHVPHTRYTPNAVFSSQDASSAIGLGIVKGPVSRSNSFADRDRPWAAGTAGGGGGAKVRRAYSHGASSGLRLGMAKREGWGKSPAEVAAAAGSALGSSTGTGPNEQEAATKSEK